MERPARPLRFGGRAGPPRSAPPLAVRTAAFPMSFTAPGPETLPEPPPGLVDAVLGAVTAELAGVAARIPDAPAAVLGRLGAASAPHGAFDVLVAERLLGALELTIGDLTPDVSRLGPYVAPPQTSGMVAVASSSGGGEAASAAGMLDQVAPGVRAEVGGLVAALAAHPTVVPLLAVPAGSEEQVAAAHGRAHLALAVVVARAVLLAVRAPIVGADAPVVVGVALDAAVRVLRQVPMPPAYVAALRERRRAEYVLPRFSASHVPVAGHRFALVEGPFPAATGEPDNGLVQVVPGGLVVRTGATDVQLSVVLQVQAEEPGEVDLAPWHELVDVSYAAVDGDAALIGPHGPAIPQPAGHTPPWPGPMRARVFARGRDDATPRDERYQIVLWPAPEMPDVVHKATDRLGHRLRGEPEPPVVVRPEAAYRWVQETGLGMAATVTVVTGSSAEDVLDAFGADPRAPTSLRVLLEQYGIDPWVAVLPVDGAVLALEYNGWQGAQAAVLQRASARGRAASMYWNANALKALSFARAGAVLASFEPPPRELPEDADVRAALDGFDVDDFYDWVEKGLVAVERFVGRGLRREDVERIEAAGVAYRIEPR